MTKNEGEPKKVKYAQRIVRKKTWWQRLLFWRRWSQQVRDFSVTTWPHGSTRNGKLYLQRDQTKWTDIQIERDCDFIGDLPSKEGLPVVAGLKYWLVIHFPPSHEEN